jgi:hypothetical protein
MRRVVLALVLILGVASVADAADVFRGCYKKVNGQLRVLVPPGKCLPSEREISFLGANALEGLNPLVYDANGQFLGVGQANEIFIPSIAKWATINLEDVSGDLVSGALYYEKADCTGQPYAEYAYLHRVFGNGQPGARKYYTAAPELEGYIMFAALADGSGNCSPFEFEYWTTPSKAVLVDLPFTVPVALPTKIVTPAATPGIAVRR